MLSARARTDILDIYANIGGRDPAAADRFLDAVSAAATRISSFPEIGSTRLWKNPALRDTRAWPVPAFPKYIL
ncbi:type II toxin-antitoxin system RelE/ParE family toxin [Indioceanicola profundi]|uniref:type II toxin-antitoxin system RelE/ParE family toxin n=1 Tax=Indioceanicola profundi TaxID=2220096 RepID=UPI001CEC7576